MLYQDGLPAIDESGGSGVAGDEFPEAGGFLATRRRTGAEARGVTPQSFCITL